AEAVRAEAQLAHDLDVLGPAAIVIARDVAGFAGLDRSLQANEAMPDIRSGAVGQRRALDLIGGSGGAPQEAARESRENGHPRAAQARGTRPFTTCSNPSSCAGMTQLPCGFPSTVICVAPGPTLTSMRYVLPRKRRVMRTSFHSGGRHGSISRPSQVGRTPSSHS